MNQYGLSLRFMFIGVLLTGIAILLLVTTARRDPDDIRNLGVDIEIRNLGWFLMAIGAAISVFGLALWPRLFQRRPRHDETAEFEAEDGS